MPTPALRPPVGSRTRSVDEAADRPRSQSILFGILSAMPGTFNLVSVRLGVPKGSGRMGRTALLAHPATSSSSFSILRRAYRGRELSEWRGMSCRVSGVRPTRSRGRPCAAGHRVADQSLRVSLHPQPTPRATDQNAICGCDISLVARMAPTWTRSPLSGCQP